MEVYHLCFHLPVLDVHLVAAQDYRYVLAHPEGTNHRIMRRIRPILRTLKEQEVDQILPWWFRRAILPADVPVPGGNILVGEP
jgi:hypothetical protein